MQKHHYLGLRGLVGKTLRYVAVYGSRWLALMGWQGDALKCQARDEWIGWSPVLQYQRLHLIANNTRFLILPGVRVMNLASRVLALNLRRLSRDWEAVHGHPVLLAETFVDLSRFKGACYRAANWVEVGKTGGYGKSGQRYWWHGQVKQVWVYPLHRRTRQWLCEPISPLRWRCRMSTAAMSARQMEDLYERLRCLPDCRKRRGIRHYFATVLTISMGAILSGARSYVSIAEWAGKLTQNQLKRLRARRDPETRQYEAPSEPTIRRVLQRADAETVDRTLGEWFLSKTDGEEGIAVDGKTLKGGRRCDGTQVHLLSAFLHQQGITVAQREVNEKTNEIPGLKNLLSPLAVKGHVITADSLHTQRETARWVVEEKGADYVFIVKDNQKTLHEDLRALQAEDFSPSVQDRRQRSRAFGDSEHPDLDAPK
jgi:predicted transposase YbfD/YdcC